MSIDNLQRSDVDYEYGEELPTEGGRVSPGKRTLTASLPARPGRAAVVQRKASRATAPAASEVVSSAWGAAVRPDLHESAARGVGESGGALPHLPTIQRAFGAHDVGGVSAHVGSSASDACDEIGAAAYAMGTDVAFRASPDLHTAAHEAAHVVQQRAGVSVEGGVGRSGDRYERHADAVADAVVAGRSAETLLTSMSGGPAPRGTAVQRVAVQMDGEDEQRLDEGDNAELDRILDERWTPEDLDTVIGNHGRRADNPEAIVSTEASTQARSEVTANAFARMRRERIDCTEAHRREADRDSQQEQAPVVEPRPNEAVPTRSPEARQQDFVQRWRLAAIMPVAASNVRAHGVREVSEAELSGTFDRSATMNDPTADMVRARIRALVTDLSNTIRTNEIAELVVNLRGHGNSEGVGCRDHTLFRRQEMMQLGDWSAGLGVHMVYVIDACGQGNTVGDAQQGRVDQAEDEGGAAGSREALLHLMLAGRPLTAQARSVRAQIATLHNEVRWAEGGRTRAWVAERLQTLEHNFAQILDRASYLTQHQVHADLAQRLQAADQAAETDRASRVSSYGSSQARVRHSLIQPFIHNVAVMLDALNDTVNALVADVDADVNRAEGAERAQPGGQPQSP